MTRQTAGSRNGGVPELILCGGRIWPGAGRPAATALAVRSGRVLAIGKDREIERLAGPGTGRIALDGRRVLPGLIDAHTHFLEGGLGLDQLTLRDAATRAEFVRRIGAEAERHPERWVLGGMWDHERWGGALPHRDWIDPVTPDTPVFVRRLDAHMALANSRALAAAGVSAATPDPPGGAIERGPDGRPTGILKDAAQTLLTAVLPAPDAPARDRALAAAAQHALACGLTAVSDMGAFPGSAGSWEGLEAYRRARAEDRLPLRVVAGVPMADHERLAAYVRQHGRGDDRLRWGFVKGFVDGSLGAATAWFHAPYDDAPETCGLTVTEPDLLRAQVLGARRAGLGVRVHAIGDRANDWLLDVFQEARAGAEPAWPLTVEHAQHLTRAAIPRFAALGVVASVQPVHLVEDGCWAERRIGRERARTTYAFRDLVDAGGTLAFGSDWPVAPLAPLPGIHAAVTRRTLDGAHPEGWVPEQKLSVEEALSAYTLGSAQALGLADRVGTLEPGKDADLVVLRDDILTIDPAAIADVRVDLTMVEGTVAFRR